LEGIVTGLRHSPKFTGAVVTADRGAFSKTDATININDRCITPVSLNAATPSRFLSAEFIII